MILTSYTCIFSSYSLLIQSPKPVVHVHASSSIDTSKISNNDNGILDQKTSAAANKTKITYLYKCQIETKFHHRGLYI